MKKIITSKHFTESEFNKCNPSCSLQDMEQDFMDKMDALRDLCGVPLVINCAYRSVEWDKAKGRSGDGDHPNRRGIDIRCSFNNSATRWKIITNAHKVGLNRIGIAKSFIHVGDTPHKAQDVVWMYQ